MNFGQLQFSRLLFMDSVTHLGVSPVEWEAEVVKKSVDSEKIELQ